MFTFCVISEGGQGQVMERVIFQLHGYPNFAWKMASYLQAPTN